MKKIFFLLLFLQILLKLNAQINYNIGLSFADFGRADGDFIQVYPTIDALIEFDYDFKNFGIATGVTTANRYFYDNSLEIFSKNIQIPILISHRKKIENTLFFVSSYFGYILTIPYETKTILNTEYDLGLSHGLYMRSSIDLQLNNFIFWGGADLSIDLKNKNNIKFYKIGFAIGMRIYLFATQ